MRYATTEVRAGDDIRTLAERLLGDYRRWRELVLINRLDYPYVAEDASAFPGNVLEAGASILYPGDPAGAPRAPNRSHNVEADAYGRDAGMNDIGSLITSGASFAVITGLLNLRDAIQRRTSTAIGGHPAHPHVRACRQAVRGRRGGRGQPPPHRAGVRAVHPAGLPRPDRQQHRHVRRPQGRAGPLPRNAHPARPGVHHRAGTRAMRRTACP